MAAINRLFVTIYCSDSRDDVSLRAPRPLR